MPFEFLSILAVRSYLMSTIVEEQYLTYFEILKSEMSATKQALLRGIKLGVAPNDLLPLEIAFKKSTP